MKCWFKKMLMGSVICFATAVFALPNENEYLQWHRDHYDELKESIQGCLEKHSLCPLLKEGPTQLYLAEDPKQIRKADKFNVTIISGIIEQDQVRLFALFFVQQQPNPFSAKAFLIYTSDDELHMPSMELFLDVCKHPFMTQKNFPKDCKVHIITTNVDQEGTYAQDWLFYNGNESLKVSLFFASDGAGGTDFAFLDT